MDRVFSVGEISEKYWSSLEAGEERDEASKMNRSASEWAFQQFLQEAAAEAHNNSDSKPTSSSSTSTSSSTVDVKVIKKDPNNMPSSLLPLDSEDYHALLKTKLNLACAAVAMSRVFLTSSLFLLAAGWWLVAGGMVLW